MLLAANGMVTSGSCQPTSESSGSSHAVQKRALFVSGQWSRVMIGVDHGEPFPRISISQRMLVLVGMNRSVSRHSAGGSA